MKSNMEQWTLIYEKIFSVEPQRIDLKSLLKEQPKSTMTLVYTSKRFIWYLREKLHFFNSNFHFFKFKNKAIKLSIEWNTKFKEQYANTEKNLHANFWYAVN